MKIAIGGDHAGFELKSNFIQYLQDKGYEVLDQGPFSQESCDYSDFAHLVAQKVASEEATYGILICGSANGVAMTANKHASIRAGLAWTTEVAGLIRAHNDANVLCVPARFVTLDQALAILVMFLNTEFEGGRHQNRVDKIPCA